MKTVPVFISMTIIELTQIISVLLGTLLGAPLILSSKPNKKLMGLFFICAGSTLAMIVQYHTELYYFFMASVYWLLNSMKAILDIKKAE
jgi:hypothetical protein